MLFFPGRMRAPKIWVFVRNGFVFAGAKFIGHEHFHAKDTIVTRGYACFEVDFIHFVARTCSASSPFLDD